MKRVLVVDDIEEYVLTIKFLISDMFEVREATSYEEAMKILEEENIDLAIIDIRLNDADPENREGLKLLEWIRENKPEITCFVMSAYKDFDYAVEALNSGAKYFFKKPLNHGEIKKILSKYS